MPGIFCFRAKERGVMGVSVKYTNEEGQTVEVVNMDEYDEEEIHEGCTVQVLRNSKTGEVSIGWWYGGYEDMPGFNPYGLPS